MSSKIYWLFLVLLLSVSTFGLWMCCFTVVLVMSSTLGFAVTLYSRWHLQMSVNFGTGYKLQKRDRFLSRGIPKVLMHMQNFSKLPKPDQRLTGSNEIDEPLRQIMWYISRDFIHSWYKDLSTNEDFDYAFSEMCRNVINNFSTSAKEVNWISFFTQRVVEDFTSHLRLYRHAEMTFRRKHPEKFDSFSTVESIFFDLEMSQEKNICRENVCSSKENEMEYLHSVGDVVLYLLLPPEDFGNKILKQFLREVLVCAILQPMLSQFSDPDVINQNLIWLCKDHSVTSKALLSILRRTDSMDELVAFQQITRHELKVQNSKDTGDKDEMKMYMKSISFVQNFAHQRYERLLGHSKQSETDSTEFYLDFDVVDSPITEIKRKLISLPFDVILNNNIALHYFTEYLASMDSEGYVFFYHNVEGFRTTVAMLRADDLSQDSSETTEKLRNLALQLFDSYLGANATSKMNLNENLLKKLLPRLKTENINETCFDEIQEKVYDILENEFYLSGFKDSKYYVKLLAELDLLHDLNSSCDLDSLSSSKSEEEEKFNCDTVVPTDEEMLNELLTAEISPGDYELPEMSSGPLLEVKEIGTLFAEVHSTGITHHAGRTFAVYAISVSHQRIEGPEEKWFVVRRYSEFYDFHEAVVAKYPVLSSFNFPSKKPFNNLTRQLMEKRRHMLNDFVQFLLSPNVLESCDGLNLMVYNFLQPSVCEKGKKSFVRTVGSFVNPIKTSVRSVGQFVKLVPDAFFELKGGFVKTFFKNSEVNSSYTITDDKPSHSKDPRTDDIPFRIILLLMDEVFNLRNKDLWFRRRIMALLRQIIKTMQGGSINKKIKDYVQGMTSASQIAEWLKLLSKSIWPDGKLAEPSPERDHSTKMRTRIVAKMLLFCAIPDELKHIIGYETSFKGAMLIFNIFQHPSLNRRLLLVLLESFLTVLFPNNKMPELFEKLHSSSPRLINTHTGSVEQINKENPFSCDAQNIPEIKIEEVHDQPNFKTCKEKKNKLSLQCLSKQSPSPRQKKRKKSIETAVFYTDLSEEDTVILPLTR